MQKSIENFKTFSYLMGLLTGLLVLASASFILKAGQYLAMGNITPLIICYSLGIFLMVVIILISYAIGCNKHKHEMEKASVTHDKHKTFHQPNDNRMFP